MKIIWLDDDIDTVQLKGIITPQRKHFDFILCRTIEEFESKLEEDWDAAILDVLDETGERTNYDIAFNILITKYSDRPFFVFSGKDNIINKENSLKKSLSRHSIERPYEHKVIYDKNNDIELIFSHIKKSVEEKEIWQTKKKYENVISVLDTINAEKEEKEVFFNILMGIEGYELKENHTVYYTPLRKILERLFRDANKRGLLHDKCINKLNLTESSRFLAGRDTEHLGVRLKNNKGHFSKLIADNVKNLLFITGGASHTTEPDKKELINLQEYWRSVNTPFLLYSLTFALCDILVWYSGYQEANNNYAENVSKWEDIIASSENNQVCGEITGFSKSGIAFLKPLAGKDTYGVHPLVYKTLKDGDKLTIEWSEQEYNGNVQKIATKILEHKPKVED